MESLFLVMVTLGTIAWSLLQASRHKRGLRELATSSGLDDIKLHGVSWFSRAGIASKARGLNVRLYEREGNNLYGRRAIMEVTSPRAAFAELGLWPESADTGLQKRFLGAREIEIGDDLFDADFFVTGTPKAARALLDAETRTLLRRHIMPHARIEISRGVLRATLDRDDVGEAMLPVVLTSVLDLAERLAGPADLRQRLTRNALEDPLPAVRLQNLLTLMREFRDPATRATLMAACGDAHVEVRLRAAAALGDAGVPTLLRLAEDGALDDVWRAEAVRRLGPRLSAEQAAAILADSLRARSLGTAVACLRLFGGYGSAGLTTLERVLAVDPDASVAAAAATALGSTRSPRAEEALLTALGHTNTDVRCAAAQALGRVGSVDAVSPLKDAAERGGERALTRAARQAVAEIQSRLGASPGRLSMTEAEAGQVSLTDAEAGRLSLPKVDAGQLSLSATAGRVSLPEPASAPSKPAASGRVRSS